MEEVQGALRNNNIEELAWLQPSIHPDWRIQWESLEEQKA